MSDKVKEAILAREKESRGETAKPKKPAKPK
jgi:hypothetical protein